jgi:hypothetical protein
MLLSERQNGLKSRAFGDKGLSGGSFFMPSCCRLGGNSVVRRDNSYGEFDNTSSKNDNSREKCDNTL